MRPASSLAASAFPAPGTVLSERSPVDGEHPYARSKAAGEAMAQLQGEFPHSVVERPELAEGDADVDRLRNRTPPGGCSTGRIVDENRVRGKPWRHGLCSRLSITPGGRPT